MWKDTDISDITVTFQTEVPTKSIRPNTSPGRPDLPRKFQALHSWCSTIHDLGKSASATTSSAPIKSQLTSQNVCTTPQVSARPSSTAGPPMAADHHACTEVFRLHTAVLCSNSAYFRARITSEVGLLKAGSKRNRTGCIDELMEVTECRAATSVLEYLYTSQLRSADSSSCSAEYLVQMMKVSLLTRAPVCKRTHVNL